MLEPTKILAAQSSRTRDNVAHSLVNHHQLLLGNWNMLTLTRKELELVEEAKRYDLDIIGVSSTKKRGSGTMDLDGGWNSAILVLILVCLLKWVWKFSLNPVCQTVCQIGFLGIMGLHVEAQGIGSVIVPIAEICPQCYE